MKSAAADPTSRRATSVCTSELARQRRPTCRYGGLTAASTIFREWPPARSSPFSRAKGFSGNSPLLPRSLRSRGLLWLLALRALQHLAHERVLRKDLEVLLQRAAGLCVVLHFDQAHHQHFSGDGIERVELDRLLEQGKSFACLSGVRESIGKIREG